MDLQSEEFEVDYSKLKADVALMRADCITRQDLKQELAAMEQRLIECINGLCRRMDKRFEEVDKRFDSMDRRLDTNEAKLEGLRSRFDTELPQLSTKADMHAAHGRMYAWMVGAILTMALGLLGLGFTIVNTMRPAAPSLPAAAAHTKIIPADAQALPRLRAS